MRKGRQSILSSDTRSGIPALDGVRGLAVLFVLLAHTKVSGFDGQGAIGVYLFFTLSGFLLSLPLDKWNSTSAKSAFLKRYFIRRLLRILPMYYSLLFCLFAFTSRDLAWLIQHALFIAADGHLWSIRQELIFYLILPLLFALLSRVKVRIVLGTLVLGAMGFVIERCLLIAWERHQFPWKGEPLYPSLFLYGVLASVLWIKRRATLPSWVGLLILCALVLSGRETINWLLSLSELAPIEGNPAWINPNFFGVLCAVFVLSAVSAEGWLKRLLESRALRLCGVLGYSMYLLHWYVFRTLFDYGVPWGIWLFGATFALTLLLSLVTYVAIERPAMRLGKRIGA